jgi:predicted nucleic acid-binding protein
MEALKLRKQLALDTNVLLDLAEGADFAQDFKETFQSRGYVLRLPPTVVTELHEQWTNGETDRKRELARKALLNIVPWNVQPLILSAVQIGIAERFAQRLLEKRLLPESEWNDTSILAETCLSEIPLLVTSDQHLLDIDEDVLMLAFNEADLFPARALHPKRLLRAIG